VRRRLPLSSRSVAHPFDRALAEPYLALARTDAEAWDSGWRAGAGLPLAGLAGLAAS
jgi:hypothetical protein